MHAIIVRMNARSRSTYVIYTNTYILRTVHRQNNAMRQHRRQLRPLSGRCCRRKSSQSPHRFRFALARNGHTHTASSVACFMHALRLKVAQRRPSIVVIVVVVYVAIVTKDHNRRSCVKLARDTNIVSASTFLSFSIPSHILHKGRTINNFIHTKHARCLIRAHLYFKSSVRSPRALPLNNRRQSPSAPCCCVSLANALARVFAHLHFFADSFVQTTPQVYFSQLCVYYYYYIVHINIQIVRMLKRVMIEHLGVSRAWLVRRLSRVWRDRHRCRTSTRVFLVSENVRINLE